MKTRNKKLKLCFLCNADVIHSKTWISYFTEKGYDIRLITDMPPKKKYAKTYLLYKIKWRLPLVDKINFILCSLQTVLYVKIIQPDILTVHFVTDYGFFGMLTGFHPLIIVPWGSDILLHPFQKTFVFKTNKLALNKCDLIICNSNQMHKTMVDKLSVSENKILDIVWPGVFFRNMSMSKTKDSNKKLIGNPSFLSYRSLNSLYNIDLIVSMFKQFQKKFINSHLYIIGEGSDKNKIENLCNDLGLNEFVTFLGRVSLSSLYYYIVNSDIILTVPKSDSCPATLLESISFNKTIIASDIEANRSWITHGKNGWLTQPDNIDNFTDTCIQAIRNPVSRKELICNSMRVRSMCDNEKNMQYIENEYIKLKSM